jgi:flagellar hook-associated protein 2
MGISVGGLSGFDTDSIIEQLIELERIPLQKLEARKEDYSAQDTAFETFNTKLLALKTASESLTDRTTWDAMKTDISDSSVLSASASSSSATGTYKFTNVVLGEQAWSKSQNDIAANSLDTTKTLDELDTAGDFQFALGGSGTGSFKIQIKDNTDTVVSESSIDYDTSTDTINTILSKINQSEAGVTAFYDESAGADGRIIITSNEPGDYYVDVDTATDTQGVINTFQLVDTDYATVSGGVPYAQVGTDTTAELNGVAINPTGNSYEVNGITINFLSDGNSTVTVNKNTDSMVSKIKDFVNKYNDVQSFIEDQTSYQDGSTGGALAGNFLVSNVGFNLSNYTLNAYSELRSNGQYSMLSEIGISLGAYGTADANKLIIDETELTNALESNPEQVELLFGYDKDNPTETNVVRDAGIAYEITQYIKPITKFQGMIDNEQEAIQSLIESLDDRIEREEENIEVMEERYRTQFSAMEQQLATLNSQGDYFASQLAG